MIILWSVFGYFRQYLVGKYCSWEKCLYTSSIKTLPVSFCDNIITEKEHHAV